MGLPSEGSLFGQLLGCLDFRLSAKAEQSTCRPAAARAVRTGAEAKVQHRQQR